MVIQDVARFLLPAILGGKFCAHHVSLFKFHIYHLLIYKQYLSQEVMAHVMVLDQELGHYLMILVHLPLLKARTTIVHFHTKEMTLSMI